MRCSTAFRADPSGRRLPQNESNSRWDFDASVQKGNGVMPSPSHNISEQEGSIKQRSNELFVEPAPQPVDLGKTTKPFAVYLRETPAQPFSPFTKMVLWSLAIVVAALFLAALWRMSHRRRPNVKPSRSLDKAAMLRAIEQPWFPQPLADYMERG